MDQALLLLRADVLRELEREKDPIRIYRAQGRVAQLRALMNLPTEVEAKIEEIKEKDRVQQLEKEEKEIQRDEQTDRRTLIW